MGKVKQGAECCVEGCEAKAVRSFSIEKVREAIKDAGGDLKSGRMRRGYLCQKHYKMFKKQTKKDKKLDKWRYGA
jgi:hypothetical protein